MFTGTFEGCTSLKSIPENLFKRIKGTAYGMFVGTFNGCSNLTSIPENLFKNIRGKKADYIYLKTFANCPNLSGNITPKFFGNINPPINSDDLTENETFLNTPKIKFQPNK
jgi:hypothetical protein